MSINDHVKTLKTRHAELEEAINRENGRPHPDEEQLHNLKRQKLKLKDEITQLEQGGCGCSSC